MTDARRPRDRTQGSSRRLCPDRCGIDLPWTRQRWPDRPDDFFIKPAAIAEEIGHVAHQDKCAWSFNVEIRPFGETW
jgi:hypothetical protein